VTLIIRMYVRIGYMHGAVSLLGPVSEREKVCRSSGRTSSKEKEKSGLGGVYWLRPVSIPRDLLAAVRPWRCGVSSGAGSYRCPIDRSTMHQDRGTNVSYSSLFNRIASAFPGASIEYVGSTV
jgi:hypothetical protein